MATKAVHGVPHGRPARLRPGPAAEPGQIRDSAIDRSTGCRAYSFLTASYVTITVSEKLSWISYSSVPPDESVRSRTDV